MNPQQRAFNSCGSPYPMSVVTPPATSDDSVAASLSPTPAGQSKPGALTSSVATSAHSPTPMFGSSVPPPTSSAPTKKTSSPLWDPLKVSAMVMAVLSKGHEKLPSKMSKNTQERPCWVSLVSSAKT